MLLLLLIIWYTRDERRNIRDDNSTEHNITERSILSLDHTSIYSILDLLYSIFYILYSIFYILYSILYSIFYILSSIFYILYTCNTLDTLLSVSPLNEEEIIKPSMTPIGAIDEYVAVKETHFLGGTFPLRKLTPIAKHSANLWTTIPTRSTIRGVRPVWKERASPSKIEWKERPDIDIYVYIWRMRYRWIYI